MTKTRKLPPPTAEELARQREEFDSVFGKAPDRTLLAKYIQYVRDIEGTDYITVHDARHESSVQFTENEWKTLEELAKTN